MAATKEKMKEVFLGSQEEVQVSPQTRTSFLKHAQRDEKSGEFYLDEHDFVNAIAPSDETYHKIKRSQYAILFRVADRQGKGRVSLQDWRTFVNLLERPDAEYEIAFRLFDVNGTGVVRFQDMKRIYEENRGDKSIPFNWDSGWASLYIGGRKHRHDMTYSQFSQLLRGLQGEKIRQAFQYFDRDGDGFILPDDFQHIIVTTVGHKLSDHLLENLPTLCNISAGSKISYADVRAFQNVIRQMDLVELVLRNAIKKSSDGRITRTDFLNEAARITRFSLFTPMEADILFHFASLDEPSGRLSLTDFSKVLDTSWRRRNNSESEGKGALDSATSAIAGGSGKMSNIMGAVVQSLHHFALGSIAGALGAFIVYPIDLVKTRMQNQRSHRVGSMMYKNSIDCAVKVVRQEGMRGLYSGVLPQLVGVAPEKAIKLTVNDLVRGKMTDPKTQKIWWPWEVVAGGTAGACQVIFTNPLEIVKIRLQVQGEVSKSVEGAPRRSATWIVRNLGLVGLYRGATACLLRDVPFSAIYFPAYNHLKRDVFGETPTRSLGMLQLLASGAIAGMPAAYLTTPCDVVKTRLQVEARTGEASYGSVRECVRAIWQQEGFRAFFKGGPARVLRSSPQFAFTLAGYEFLQTLFPLERNSSAVAPSAAKAAAADAAAMGAGESQASLPYLRSRNALKIILDLDQNFGLNALKR